MTAPVVELTRGQEPTWVVADPVPLDAGEEFQCRMALHYLREPYIGWASALGRFIRWQGLRPADLWGTPEGAARLLPPTPERLIRRAERAGRKAYEACRADQRANPRNHRRPRGQA